MAFCTKCGQQLVEGEVHVCPAANNNQQPAPEPQAAPVQEGFNPYDAGGAPQQPPADNGFQQPPVNGGFYQQPPVNGGFQQPPQGEKAVAFNSDNSTIDVSINTEAVKDKYFDIKNKITQGDHSSERSSVDAYERGMKIVPECIAANDGEIPIKQYNIAKLRTRIILAFAEGRLQVTNKRVIFRATGRSIFGRVSLHEEFKINEIAGVEIRNRPEFNFFNLFAALIITVICGGAGAGISYGLDNTAFAVIASILGLIVAAAWIFLAVIFHQANSLKRFYSPRLAALALFGGMAGGYASNEGNGFYYFVAGLLGLLALINIFLLLFVPDLVIKIKTKGSFPGIDVVKEQPFALLSFLFGKQRDDSSGFLEVLAWKDTDLATKELGTMIDDIQTLGDAAIEKWKVD